MPPTETEQGMLCLSRHENCPWEQALKAADVPWTGLQYACLKVLHLYCKVFEQEDIIDMVIRKSVAYSYAGPSMPEWMSPPHSTGTIVMACKFDSGVVIGADSRTTVGAYITNRVADKLTKITDHIYCCRSGFAADTQAIADIVSHHLNYHQIALGEAPLVKTAASIFRELCYNYRDSLVAGILVAGWDKRQGGQIYSVPVGGMMQREAISIEGSGSTYVYGYVDANFKSNMKEDEAVQFVTNTLALAMLRDASSGGVVLLGVITEAGVKRSVILGDQLPKFYEG